MTKAFYPVNERLARLLKEIAIPMPDFSILKYATILIPKLIGPGSGFTVQRLQLFETDYYIDHDSKYPTSPIG